MTLDLLFDGANIFVLPFWALMILLPNWGVTRKVMESYLPFVVLAGVYAYLFVNSVDPETAQSFSNPTLTDLAQLFADERVTATGWIHFLVADLFVGRWIYWEGQRTGVWTVHSLILCLFAGPLGLLSHITTQAVTKRFFQKTTTAPEQVTDVA
ncbi:MAG: ABA4-like family protein [Oculatellaceae cyanobacterium bins.114]|nr:ABA4-like family protein [Oculatellaceae cyanobacterium bins.114]